MTIDVPPLERERLPADGQGFPRAAAESIEWLIDNAEAYARLLEALRSARRSIRMAQLALDADCVAYTDAQGITDEPSKSSVGEVLAETLLAIGARGQVDVSVLLNATLLLDTTKPLRRYLEAAGACGIRLRGISRFPQLLHAKMVIVDGTEAFVLGSPFVNGYWDNQQHRPVDARRPTRELGGRPLHDVSLRVTGRVVADLDAMFCDLWNGAKAPSGDRRRELRPHPLRATARHRHGALRVVRSVPRGGLRSMPEGATEILEACLDGIARARSLIYIEHQYLSARPVVTALATALRRVPTLEIIAVLNQNPDITAYRVWQNTRLGESGLLEHPRVGLFALWSVAPHSGDAGRLAINQVFVHSKVLAVDDRWATVGSANLDGVSLHSYGDDFDGWLGRRLFRGIRNFDVNIVVDEGFDGARRSGIGDLRLRLWSEHLGMSRDDLVVAPPGGWVAFWRERSVANIAALNAECEGGRVPSRMQGFVLPYSPGATPAGQLAHIGVRVPSDKLDLRFNPGWLEVRFSPNWVRNMFL